MRKRVFGGGVAGLRLTRRGSQAVAEDDEAGVGGKVCGGVGAAVRFVAAPLGEVVASTASASTTSPARKAALWNWASASSLDTGVRAFGCGPSSSSWSSRKN